MNCIDIISKIDRFLKYKRGVLILQAMVFEGNTEDADLFNNFDNIIKHLGIDCLQQTGGMVSYGGNKKKI